MKVKSSGKAKYAELNSFIFLFTCLLLLLNSKANCIVVIPFKITTINQKQESADYNITNLIEDYFSRDMYANLQIGTPNKKVLTLLSSDSHYFIFGENYLNRKSLKELKDPENSISKTNYEIAGSSSYKNITFIDYSYRVLKTATLSSDNFTFYTNVNLNETAKVDEMEFLVNEDRDESMSVLLGLNKPTSYQYEGPPHLLDCLKKAGVIKDESWTLKFLSKTDGQLIIGDEPHLYEDIQKDLKYQKQFFYKTSSLSINEFFHPWSFNCEKVSFKSKEHSYLDQNIKSYIELSNGFIIGTEYYRQNITEIFFDELIKLGICTYDENDYINEKEVSYTYYSFSCDKKKFTGTNNYYARFPTLSFFSSEFLYTFELTNKDLFVEVNDKYHFLILFEKTVYPHPEDDAWYLGLPFVEKYQFVFNYQTNSIGFYLPQKAEGGDGSGSSFPIKIAIEIGIGIALLLLAFYLGKKWNDSNKRKKRANELKDDDDYTYPLEKN